MKSLYEVKAFYKDATVDTNPASDRAVLTDALKAGGLKTQKRTAHAEPRIWRFVMKNSITRSAATALVVLVAVLGISLFNGSTQPVYGITEALELMARAKTMHIQGWGLNQGRLPGEPLKLAFEKWYDFENGRYWLDNEYCRDGETGNSLIVCDGEYLMQEGAIKTRGGPWENTVKFERVDPEVMVYGTGLGWYKQLRQIEGFARVGEELINGEHYDIWQGEYDKGAGNDARRHRVQAWLSPKTGNVGRTRNLWQEDGQWVIWFERTLIERDVPLAEGLFVTEPRPGHKIETTKQEARVRDRRPMDIYKHTEYDYAPLMYWVRAVFALKGGCLLACWQGVDNLESRDQSKYFADLQVGGDLPKLPIEVFALSPQPNVRDITFVGFHLAHTERETELGRRWYEWSLYVPDKEPPEPDAVLHYRIHHRLNVERTDSIKFSVSQNATRSPQIVESQAEFEAKILAAMAERSDNGSIPEHVTYENVMRIANQLQALIAK